MCVCVYDNAKYGTSLNIDGCLQQTVRAIILFNWGFFFFQINLTNLWFIHNLPEYLFSAQTYFLLETLCLNVVMTETVVK